MEEPFVGEVQEGMAAHTLEIEAKRAVILALLVRMGRFPTAYHRLIDVE